MESIPHVFVELRALNNKKQLFGQLPLEERLKKKDDLLNLNNQISNKWEQCRLTYIDSNSESRHLIKDYKISNAYLILLHKLDNEFPLQILNSDKINPDLSKDLIVTSDISNNNYEQIVDLIDKWLNTYNGEIKDKLFSSLVKIIFKRNYFDQKKFIDKDNSRIVLNLLKIIKELNLTHNLNQNLIYRSSVLNICSFCPSVVTFEDQTEYHGEYDNDEFNGFGVLIEKKYTDLYIGEFEENNCSGFGIQVYENGDFYFGEFKDDHRHGFGRYTWSDRDSYSGIWINGKQSDQINAPIDNDPVRDGIDFEKQKKQFIRNLPSFDKMIEQFNFAHKSNFKILETNNEKLNYLIQLITMDNRISDIERKFLIEKTRELNLTIELLQEAEEYLETNNPFLDKIFELIFNDGVINKNELEFIHEKTLEFGLFEDIVNERFWSYAIHFNLSDLLKISEFNEWVFIWYLNTNFSSNENPIPINTKLWLDIFSGNDFIEIIKENCQKVKEKNINEIGVDISYEEYIQIQKNTRKEVQIDLSSTSDLHKDALCWFAINRQKSVNYIEIIGEKRFNSGNIFLFNSAKGIHKPRTESYVLSIKVLLDSFYNDKIEEAYGSWSLKYHKEDGNEWTNDGLIKCMEDNVPIGLFYQTKSPPAPIYKVYGLGLIHSYDGNHFFINEIRDADYKMFNWDPYWKENVSTANLIQTVGKTDLSEENTFWRFSSLEKDEVINLLKSKQFLPASNCFLKYSFKYGIEDYKKINRYFDELENLIS